MRKYGEGTNHVMDGAVTQNDCELSSWHNVVVTESDGNRWSSK